MPFIPHSPSDVTAMLEAIGVSTIDELFDEIPPALKAGGLEQVPAGLNEQEVTRLLRQHARQDEDVLIFAGAGAYEHHIPAAVWAIATRGEFYSAYTPYQAEASQGTLQLIYEYQSMLCQLTGMDVSNASLYDGASALAEAALMAVRVVKKPVRRILVPQSVHPAYRQTLQTILALQDVEVVELPVPSGRLDVAWLRTQSFVEFAALVIPQPNFFGLLESVDALCDWAHAQGALAIGLVNPLSLAVLSAPGEWGQHGADIVCGDGQPLGVPLASGGPYFGLLACKQAYVRQMSGRIVGRTLDLDGKTGFTLTLQAREQHIRRAKANSNICTNQGLLVTAATIYMALLGPEGLRRVAIGSMHNTRLLRDRLLRIDGLRLRFEGPFFHELVLELPQSAMRVVEALAGGRIVAGYPLGADYPGFEQALLVCATELRTEADIERYAAALEDALQAPG